MFYQKTSLRTPNQKISHVKENKQTYISTNCNVIDNTIIFDYTCLKKEKKRLYELHHWETDKRILEKANKKHKDPEHFRFGGETTRIYTTWKPRFKFDSNRKVWVLRKPDNKRRDKVASTDLKLLFENNEEAMRWRIF